MITANGRSCSRISSGSSTAATSDSVDLACSETLTTVTLLIGSSVPPDEARVVGSDMIAQHQLARMGLEIDLAVQIGDLVTTNVVADQSQRHDQRHEPG